MAERKVTQSRKDKDGDITALCNPLAAWSPRAKAGAITDIESKTHRYYVQRPGTSPTYVHVVDGPTGKYLRTNPDDQQGNNLDSLPDC